MTLANLGVPSRLDLRGKTVVWATCWFDEEVPTVLNAIGAARISLEVLGAQCKTFVFDARHDRESTERAQVIAGCDGLIANGIDAYPNKNLGVLLSAEVASHLDADIVVVADPDWRMTRPLEFPVSMVTPIASRFADVVLPDITAFAGRSNYLVGGPMMAVAAPGMGNSISTPFPGALATNTTTLRSITSDPRYHFDWGGEWDLAYGFWTRADRVYSPDLGMVNVRHRSNSSKSSDAAQIWRSGLPSLSPVLADAARPSDQLAGRAAELLNVPHLISSLEGTATNQLRALKGRMRGDSRAEVLELLMPMVLEPLACLLDGLTIQPSAPAKRRAQPYIRSQLKPLSVLARLSACQAISASDGNHKDGEDMVGGSFGSWTPRLRADARQFAKESAESLAIRWT